MIDAILTEAKTIADSRNDEVVDWLLRRLEAEQAEALEAELVKTCAFCWTKFKYVSAKLRAHRLKRRMERIDDDRRYPGLCRERDEALEEAFSFRQHMGDVACVCRGKIFKDIGRQFLSQKRSRSPLIGEDNA